jgi:hypothetical protein
MVPTMSLRTAPCPSCGNTIVFGERRCRSCGTTFDYGATPPPEPTAAQVFDALAGVPIVSAVHRPVEPDVPTLPGLDTGRYEVGEVQLDDIPGLVDSTLFRAMTPEYVDVVPMSGIERTMQAEVDVPLAVAVIPGLDTRIDAVDVADIAPVPGLFGSDVFRTDVDISAGAAAAGDILEVSPNAARRSRIDDDASRRSVCPSCSTIHFRRRCPSCGTAAPTDD